MNSFADIFLELQTKITEKNLPQKKLTKQKLGFNSESEMPEKT